MRNTLNTLRTNIMNGNNCSVRLKNLYKRNEIEMLHNALYLNTVVPEQMSTYDDIARYVNEEVKKHRLPFLVRSAGVKTYTELVTLIRETYASHKEIKTVDEYWKAFEETTQNIVREVVRYDTKYNDTKAYWHSPLLPLDEHEKSLLKQRVTQVIDSKYSML